MPLTKLDNATALIVIDLQEGIAGLPAMSHPGDYIYNAALVVDAMTDPNAESHRHCAVRIFPCLGETATTDELLRAMPT